MSKKFDITKTKKNGYIVNVSADDWGLYDVEDQDGVACEEDRIDSAKALNKALEDALNSTFHVAQVYHNMNKAMENEDEWGASDSAVCDVLFAIGCELFDDDIADEHFNL